MLESYSQAAARLAVRHFADREMRCGSVVGDAGPLHPRAHPITLPYVV